MNVERPEVPDEDSEKDRWLRMEHTLKLRRGFRVKTRDAHSVLMSKCAQSSDPAVRQEYERYMSAKTTQLLFESESSKKDPDADST